MRLCSAVSKGVFLSLFPVQALSVCVSVRECVCACVCMGQAGRGTSLGSLSEMTRLPSPCPAGGDAPLTGRQKDRGGPGHPGTPGRAPCQ